MTAVPTSSATPRTVAGMDGPVIPNLPRPSGIVRPITTPLMLYLVESMSTATRCCFCFDYSLGCFPPSQVKSQVKSYVDITRSRWLLSARLGQTIDSIPIQDTLHYRSREKARSKQIRTIHILALHGLVGSETTKPSYHGTLWVKKVRNTTFHGPTDFAV
jgi:hypothetical protein